MEANRLRPEDHVSVEVFADGHGQGKYDGTGFRNVEEAVETAYVKCGITVPKPDCVFEVSDDSRDTSERYRYNAHGHLRLIV